MRAPRNFRKLTAAEGWEARKVFVNSITVLDEVYLSDGIGAGDDPFAIPSKSADRTARILSIWGVSIKFPGKYVLFVGDDYSTDMSKGEAARTLIHELTHVWQYEHGYDVVVNSLANRIELGSDMYEYDDKNYKGWDEYNVEQQARLIETWYRDYVQPPPKAERDRRWEYIEWNIRGHHRQAPPAEYHLNTLRPDLPFTGSVTDPLAEIMAPRYGPGDARSLERVKLLELYFNRTSRPKQLLARIEARRPTDKGVRDFFHVLDPRTVARLLDILKRRPPDMLAAHKDPWR